MNTILIKQMLENYGTPAYLYNKEDIIRAYSKLKSILPKEAEIFYSVKANPLAGVCSLLKMLGGKAEIASYGELLTAMRGGFQPKDIIFSGPGKTEEELKQAVRNGIYSINAESMDELSIINEIGDSMKKKICVGVRINPDFFSTAAELKMSGSSTQFGIDEGIIDKNFANFLRSLDHVNLIGIHIYMGTEILNADAIIQNTEQIIQSAQKLEKVCQTKLAYVDFGGGFGVPCFKNDKELDLEQLKSGMQDLFDRYRAYFKAGNRKTFFESGRFLLAESGIFATRVTYVKCCKGKKYIICDGGSNFHSASAFLGRFVRNNYPISVLRNEEDIDSRPEGTEKVTVCGPLCTPTDVIGQNVELPAGIKRGDIILIHHSGACGFTYSPIYFLSHRTPVEVLYDSKGNSIILRGRGKAEDLLRGQHGFI